MKVLNNSNNLKNFNTENIIISNQSGSYEQQQHGMSGYDNSNLSNMSINSDNNSDMDTTLVTEN